MAKRLTAYKELLTTLNNLVGKKTLNIPKYIWLHSIYACSNKKRINRKQAMWVITFVYLCKANINIKYEFLGDRLVR